VHIVGILLAAGSSARFGGDKLLEPLPHAMLGEDACEQAYLAIADMIDMRMPFTFGHSRAVAELAHAAGKQMGLPASDIRDVRWAGYTHDLGELAVPVATWMRPGALTQRETDEARLHPYHGERALASMGGEGKARRERKPDKCDQMAET